jgi:hypothetical protein
MMMPIMPMPAYPHHGWQAGALIVPEEAVVDTTTPSKTVVIGGTTPVRLSLEYLPDDGATSASVKVTSTVDGTATTWQETPIAAGYHVKTDFAPLLPGSKVTIDVAQAMARVRWCETVCS